ncbi:MAG TPA: PD-(D/E)XK nuclease family protein [Polyangiaceae bacterium]|nr:PD-(D/E)XK nuclease family protein [Polyangiaceae bacterium]
MHPSDTWLLVPTERHVEALAAAGTQATTLRKLVAELAAAEAPELLPTTPEATRLLIAELVGCRIGHAKALDDAIGRLRRAGTRAESLRATRLRRGERFADLLGATNDRLTSQKLRDDREAAWLAARYLNRSTELATGATRAVVRGLSRWDPSTLAFLEALHAALRRRGGEGVVIELPEHGVPALSGSVQALATELEARWAHENDHPSLTFESTEALAKGRVELVETMDPASEARAAARAVLEALARGVALDRIAIVPVDLSEAFLEPLRFELLRAKIPFVEPRGRPVIAAPRAHAALELLRLARGPLTRDGLVDVLRVPGLSVERWFGSVAALELAHELEKLPIRVERVAGDLVAELEQRVQRLAAEQRMDAAQAATMRDGLSLFLAELAALGGDAPRGAHARRFRAFFDELGLLATSPREVERALSRERHGAPELLLGLGHDAVASAAVRSASERAVAAAVALGLGEREVRLDTWLEELELALEGVAPSRGAARAAAVRIARTDDVAFMDLGLVVLCRASDGSLDRSTSLDATLGPELENKLPKRERPPGANVEQHFSSLGVAAALARAESVVVTWSRRDESASTLLPSRLARSLIERSGVRREPGSPLSPRARRAAARKAPSPNATERTRVERARAAFYASPDCAPDALNGEAGDLRAFFGAVPERPVAITAIERGLRCSFLAFASQVLRASRLDPVGDAIGARERGSLLHEALAAALQESSGVRENGTIEEFVEQGVQAAARLLEQKGKSPLRRVGLRSTLADVRAVLRLLAAKDDGMGFRLAEHGFGTGEGWAPLSVGSFMTSGRIDRVDASPDGRRVRVLDYKTRTPARADESLLLQPWLYAEKAARELGASEVEFCFVGVDGRTPSARVVYSGPLDGEPLREAEHRALTVLTALSDGHVAARPASGAFCPRCDARDICRRPLSSPEGTDE